MFRSGTHNPVNSTQSGLLPLFPHHFLSSGYKYSLPLSGWGILNHSWSGVLPDSNHHHSEGLWQVADKAFPCSSTVVADLNTERLVLVTKHLISGLNPNAPMSRLNTVQSGALREGRIQKGKERAPCKIQPEMV